MNRFRVRSSCRVSAWWGVLLMAWLGLPGSGSGMVKPPNVIVILADDLGYSDLGCYGGEVDTPHLDQLAREGLRFRSFYNTSRCSMSRAALLTGLYPHRAGVGHLDQDLGAPGYRGFLNERCATISELLQHAGYHTAMTGKWHLGKERAHWPDRRGFTRQFVSPAGGGFYFLPVQSQIGKRPIYLDDRELSEQELREADGDPDAFYSTDDFTDHAIRFIEEAVEAETPFFLYLAYIAPHWPLEAPEAEVRKYLERGTYGAGWEVLRGRRLARQRAPGGIAADLNDTPGEWELSPAEERWEELDQDTRRKLAEKMAVHAAVVDRMDQNIGRLLAFLDDPNQDGARQDGIADNTLVVFLSDNGASSSGGVDGQGTNGSPVGGGDSRDIRYGSGWANLSNAPFRRFKKETEEGGVLTPCIMRWPQGVHRPKGSIVSTRAHLIDLMPTVLEVAGVAYPTEFRGRALAPLAGVSLVPLFREGGTIERGEPLFFEHEGRSAVLAGDLKAVAQDDPDADRFELYDLSRDPQELRDQAEARPDVVTRLREEWFSWAKRNDVLDWAGRMPREFSRRDRR